MVMAEGLGELGGFEGTSYFSRTSTRDNEMSYWGVERKEDLKELVTSDGRTGGPLQEVKIIVVKNTVDKLRILYVRCTFLYNMQCICWIAQYLLSTNSVLAQY